MNEAFQHQREDHRVVAQSTIQSILYHFPVDPLAEYMRRQGFNPNTGARLVLPTHMVRELGPNKPVYVESRDGLRDPVLLQHGVALRF